MDTNTDHLVITTLHGKFNCLHCGQTYDWVQGAWEKDHHDCELADQDHELLKEHDKLEEEVTKAEGVLI